MGALLIVNADDYGADARTTDAIVECFDAGAITSASAMVWMEGTAQAAALDREQGGLALGLHLNVTEPFSAPNVPDGVRERQTRFVTRLARARFRRLGFDPRLLSIARATVADQLDRFREEFGRDPTHIDGHSHAHLNPTVLAALPRGACVRTAQAPPGGGRGGLARATRHSLLRRRFRTTDWFYAVEELEPSLGGGGLAPVDRALAAGESVEIMCHPGRPEEHAFLLGERWRSALLGRPLGSYAEL